MFCWFVDDGTNWMGFIDKLPPQSQALGAKIRELLKTHKVQEKMLEYVESAEPPVKIIPILQELGVGQYFYDNDYTQVDRGGKITPVTDPWAKVVTVLEVSVFAAQNCLLGRTIELYGSDYLKNLYLPRLQRWDMLGGWGLTEEFVGSDASNIQTRAKVDPATGDFLLYGNKKWIGNGHGDIMAVFACDESRQGEVGCFLIDLTAPGVSRTKIHGKMPLRPVQNMILKFDGVKIPKSHRIDGVKGFGSVAKVLADSRIMVGWLAVGMQFGIYDTMMKYLLQRKQFGQSLVAFQFGIFKID